MAFRLCLFCCMMCASQLLVAQKSKDLPLPPFTSEVKETDALKKGFSDEEIAALKGDIKSEVLQELKASEREWKQQAQPQLNFLELDGYLRMRIDALNRCDLGTFIPGKNKGTSGCPSPLSYFGNSTTLPEDVGAADRSSWLFSTNMRLRVDPTLNVSEDIRIRGTVDVFDNLVIGSTPNYMTGLDFPNPSYPYSFLSTTQNAPLIGINNPYGSINVKRVWGEIATPVGELRFGRMPMHFGLGLLYNSGNIDTNDYGDNIDGIMFATRVMGHYLIPGVSVAYTGPIGRGGGYGQAGDGGQRFVHGELGQRYDLDPSDNVYSFFLTFAKKDKDLDAKMLLNEGKTVFNYGVLGSYRFQIYDSMYTQLYPDSAKQPLTSNPSSAVELSKKLLRRDTHVGFLSLWGDVRWDRLRVEAEAVGIFGQIGNTQGLRTDLTASTPVWILQGGAALKSRYGFLNDRLEVGLDAGWASGDTAFGFGARPGLNKEPADGSAEGQQFGANDAYLTNFRFNPDYRIDMLLFREILGSVTDAFYLRPHIGYFFTENFGIRGDVISSFSNFAISTPGNSSLLGIEIDASIFYHTEDGFHFRVQYGLLVPFNGLNHQDKVIGTSDFAKFGTASTASAIQVFAGISF